MRREIAKILCRRRRLQTADMSTVRREAGEGDSQVPILHIADCSRYDKTVKARDDSLEFYKHPCNCVYTLSCGHRLHMRIDMESYVYMYYVYGTNILLEISTRLLTAGAFILNYFL